MKKAVIDQVCKQANYSKVQKHTAASNTELCNTFHFYFIQVQYFHLKCLVLTKKDSPLAKKFN